MADYDNSLNLPIRISQDPDGWGGWLGCVALCIDSPAFDDDLLEAIVASVRCQLESLKHRLSAKGNFRIVQAMCYVSAGLRLPFLEEAPEWRRLGVRVLNDAARRQILPDGAHDECTAGYHGWMMRVFTRCVRMQQRLPDLGFCLDAKSVARMYDYAAANTRPDGSNASVTGCW